MQNHNNHATQSATRSERKEAGKDVSKDVGKDASKDASDASEPPTLTRPWQVEVGQLLQRAAALCSEHGVDVNAYMSGAWSAYVEARPGMREQLEEAQLREQLDELRKLGRIGEA